MKKIISMLLMLICIFSIGTIPASATTLAADTYGVKMNGEDTGVRAEMVDGELWLTDTYSDIMKIWPNEARALTQITQRGIRTPLVDWVDTFDGYEMIISGHTAYITYYGNNPSGNAGTGNGNTNTPNVTDQVAIYVNGTKSRVIGKLKNGEVYLTDAYSDLRVLFPDETKNMVFPTQKDVEQKLADWTSPFGYKQVLSGTTVYLSKTATNNGGSNNTDTTTMVAIYVNGTKTSVSGKLKNGNVYLTDAYSDLRKIFPKETQGIIFPTQRNSEQLLSEWAKAFEYTQVLSGGNVYLSNTGNTGNGGNTGNSGNTGNGNSGTQPTTNDTVSIYVNGMKSKVYGKLINGQVYLGNTYSDVKVLFPKETERMSFPAVTGVETKLKEWADTYQYKFVQSGFRVYLNNNGISPIIVQVNGKIVEFPDQQPLIKDGRTMIPIRALSDSMGLDVKWSDNGYVTITDGTNIMKLFIGSKVYTLNGEEKVLDVPAEIMNDRTMVPVRFVAEAMNGNVTWTPGDINIVSITFN